MEMDKVITYSAIGVAGIVCLVFLLDLAAGNLRSAVGNGHFVYPGVGVPFVARRRDGARAPASQSQATRCLALYVAGLPGVGAVDPGVRMMRRGAAIVGDACHQSVDQAAPM